MGNTTNAIGSTVSSLFGAVMYYPMSIVNSIMGNTTNGKTPALHWTSCVWLALPALSLACVLFSALYEY